MKVGDIVIGTKHYDENNGIVGTPGIIVSIDDSPIVSVFFFKHIDGHTCSGLAKDNYGWETDKKCLSYPKDWNERATIIKEYSELYQEAISLIK